MKLDVLVRGLDGKVLFSFKEPGLQAVSLMKWGAPFGSGELGVARRFLVGSELAVV